ncbi:MAG: 4Fe-4S dicluster domain-containing protein [Verrucomicrobiales bacterium]|nr:4Fe-4S dicluster domain-containing protein [Verrucomicrobiales bacterium]
MTYTRETFGNIPALSQWLFYVLAALSVAVFCFGIWRRFQLWRQGQPIDLSGLLVGSVKERLARWKPGLRRVAVEGFGQQRVRGRGLPSWSHAVLVAGFLMLFLGTTLLEVDHLAGMVSERLKFHRGTYYLIYEFTLDVFGLLFLLGCMGFLIRRIRRPASVGHRPSDWMVLALFIAIGVTGYWVEGLRIAWQQPTGLGASCSPVGRWVAAGFAGWTESQARAWHLGVWWLHAILVFGFFACIPFTRLIHFVTGPLNLFLTKPALGELVPITVEEMEKTERMGVSEIRHFTQAQLLSLDACMECGRCEEACPAFATAKPLSPKKVVQDLKGIMSGIVGNAPATSVHEVIAAETLWSCTACNACAFVCPVRIDPVRLIIDMRRHLVAEGGLSGTAAVALRRMQSSANPWGLPPSERGRWMESAATDAPGTTPGAPT